MKKYFMSAISVLLAVSLCACSIGISTETEETETQVLDEFEKTLSIEDKEPEKESTICETEEVTSEGNLPGADVVEIVNLRGDETTIYKLADGTYMDRIERHFIYNGTDTWTDEDGVEWNEVVEQQKDVETSANEKSSTKVDKVTENEAWKVELEKDFFENYGVIPKYYENQENGIYQVYVEVGGEVIPFATVDSSTGNYQVKW